MDLCLGKASEAMLQIRIYNLETIAQLALYVPNMPDISMVPMVVQNPKF